MATSSTPNICPICWHESWGCRCSKETLYYAIGLERGRRLEASLEIERLRNELDLTRRAAELNKLMLIEMENLNNNMKIYIESLEHRIKERAIIEHERRTRGLLKRRPEKPLIPPSENEVGI